MTTPRPNRLPTAARLLDPLDGRGGAAYSPAAQVRRLAGNFYGPAQWSADEIARLATVAALAARLGGSRRLPIQAASFGKAKVPDIHAERCVTLPRPRIITDGRHNATTRELDRAADIVAGLATMHGARAYADNPAAIRGTITRHGIGWTLGDDRADWNGDRVRFAAWCREDDGATNWMDEPQPGTPRAELQTPLHTAARIAWAATAATAAHDPEAATHPRHTLRLIRAAAVHGREAFDAIRATIDPERLAHLSPDQREQIAHYLDTLAEDLSARRAVDPYGARAWRILSPESNDPEPTGREIDAERGAVRDQMRDNAHTTAHNATDENAQGANYETGPDEAAAAAAANESGEVTHSTIRTDPTERVKVSAGTIVAPQRRPISVRCAAIRGGARR
jgi:hypothetical protein